MLHLVEGGGVTTTAILATMPLPQLRSQMTMSLLLRLQIECNSAKIGSDAVTSTKIADDAVTLTI